MRKRSNHICTFCIFHPLPNHADPPNYHHLVLMSRSRSAWRSASAPSLRAPRAAITDPIPPAVPLQIYQIYLSMCIYTYMYNVHVESKWLIVTLCVCKTFPPGNKSNYISCITYISTWPLLFQSRQLAWSKYISQ